MIDRADAHEFVRDLLDELYSAVDTANYQSYIRRQTVPFLLQDLKDAILQTVEVWRC